MIKAWSDLASIITIRIIIIISAQIVSGMRGLFVVRPRAQVDFVLGQQRTLAIYPECKAYYQGASYTPVLVKADFNGNALELASSLAVVFGSAGWIALWLHVIAAEVYVSYFPVRLIEKLLTHGTASIDSRRERTAAPAQKATRQDELRIVDNNDEDTPQHSFLGCWSHDWRHRMFLINCIRADTLTTSSHDSPNRSYLAAPPTSCRGLLVAV